MTVVKDLHQLGIADLAVAGGKGANLGALLRAGLPVPPGFCVTTAAYRAFLEIDDLGDRIRRTVDAVRPDDTGSPDRAADAIRDLFTGHAVPGDLAAEITRAYTGLPGPSGPGEASVAVRSSATAEDLPELSFAGQHDTLLNIVGSEALLDAVVRCWASLWTARAIGYRARNGIDHESQALAVVVQLMVPSEASGVLFTANPLTGRRTETVIDATIGLGEALVSGMVEPDHFVVDDGTERVISRSLGAKALSVRGLPGGGTVTRQEPAKDRQSLPDDQVLALARLGRRAEKAFGTPQDLEWAWADGRLYVVQSRPITSLYPLPENPASPALPENPASPANPGNPENPGNPAGGPLRTLFSFGAWQGMLDPFTPLGRDLFCYLAVGVGRLFGADLTAREQRAFAIAGERLFIDLSEVLRSGPGRVIVRNVLPEIDPVSARILDGVLKDPRFAVSRSLSTRTRWRLLRGLAPFVGNTLATTLWPAWGRARIEARITAELAATESACAAAEDLSAVTDALRSTLVELPRRMMPRLVAGVASGQVPYQELMHHVDVPGGRQLLMELSLGLPHNVTTGMNLDLWRSPEPSGGCGCCTPLLWHGARHPGCRVRPRHVASRGAVRRPGLLGSVRFARNRGDRHRSSTLAGGPVRSVRRPPGIPRDTGGGFAGDHLPARCAAGGYGTGTPPSALPAQASQRPQGPSHRRRHQPLPRAGRVAGDTEVLRRAHPGALPAGPAHRRCPVGGQRGAVPAG
jgi:pyruvate,water dikinase